jgi:hypothetical protein
VKSFEQFHDGFYNGLLIREGFVNVFVADHIKQRFVVSATEVAALASTDIREGNIIFNIVCRRGIEITLDDIREAHGLGDRPQDMSHAQRAIAKALELELSFLVLSSSYGGTLAMLVESPNRCENRSNHAGLKRSRDMYHYPAGLAKRGGQRSATFVGEGATPGR